MGEELYAGERFTIEGSNFDKWPSEIVLTFSTAYLQDSLPSTRIMELVERTDNKLTFEVVVGHTFGGAHTWGLFATPEVAPREVLSYEVE